jgi:hypothetical protein
MKILFIMFLVLSGCMNIPEKKIATTSSRQLCTSSCYIAISSENRELIYKELESRGYNCTCDNKRLVFPSTQAKETTKTHCYNIGNDTYCDTK